MKKTQFFLLFVLLVSAISNANSQTYKQPIPSINSAGKVTDLTGKHIGWITADGVIKDAAGAKIAHIDDKGNVVDSHTGKVMGKAAKNGTYLYHVKGGAADSLTISAPMNGTCEVKNKNGKVVLLVHENYKQYGACALHCLQMKKERKDMKMK